MRANGLLQPIAVRIVPNGYELIAGERRLRAAQALGWNSIPAVIRQLDERGMLTLALVENLQRTDLNAIEEADGYLRLQREFALTQQQIADAVGKDRSTIANLLRLRSLPEDVRNMVRDGRLTVGHARALLALPPQLSPSSIANRIVAESLSVRDVEQLTRTRVGRLEVSPRASAASPATSPAAPARASAELRRLTDDLRRFLQTDIAVSADAKGQGELRVRFYSPEDLERVVQLILHSHS